jgi:4-amino-4-deoxy-L-arabinose transferase-like glycosyltransferase
MGRSIMWRRQSEQPGSGLIDGEACSRSVRDRVLVCAGLAALFFAAVAPTLTWPGFANGSENLNVATVLEMVRDRGALKIVPTLQLKPRINKPPLTAWVNAAAVPASTVAGMSSPDPAVRTAAQRALAWRVRCVALLAGCGTIVATYLLAELLAGPSLAAIAALACGTTLMFLRQARLSTTDIQLALWVAVANVFIARTLLRGTTWTNCLGAGLALALALMSKGPVALVQTLAPAAVWVGWVRWTRDPAQSAAAPRVRLGPVVVGLLVMVVAGGAWFGYVLSREAQHGLLDGWWREVAREGATTLSPSRWYNYLVIFPALLPWFAFLIVGLVLAWRELAARRVEPLLLALFLLVVPILIMSLFRDRKERYLLPMTSAGAIVIAWGVREHLRGWATWSRTDTVTTAIHWSIVGVAAVGLPVLGAMRVGGLTTVDGQPWYSPPFAAVAATALGALAAAAAIWHLRWKGALVTGTVAVMLLLQAVAAYGYRRSPQSVGRMKPFAEMIWEVAPDADVVNAYRNRVITPSNLSIYLNRAIPIQPGVPAPQGRPVVLLLYQRKGDPAPLRPDGFRRIAEMTEEDGSSWYAVIRR